MRTTCYLVLEPTFTQAGKLRNVKVARTTARYPRAQSPGTYVVKLNLSVPDEVFEPPVVDVQVRTAKVDEAKVKTEKPAAVSKR